MNRLHFQIRELIKICLLKDRISRNEPMERNGWLFIAESEMLLHLGVMGVHVFLRCCSYHLGYTFAETATVQAIQPLGEEEKIGNRQR